MRKVNRLLSLCLVASLLVYTGCKEKETPVPTENTARIDALRQELLNLQQQVLGQTNNENSQKIEKALLEGDVKELQAEITKLKAEQARSITYTIYATDLQGVFQAGAEVSIVVNGAVTKKTTDTEGKAVFEGVRSGVVSGFVKTANFTSANFTASVAFGGDFVSTKVPLLPLAGGANTFTVEGKLYADLSDADDNLNEFDTYNNISGTNVIINVPAGPNNNSTETKYDGQARKITFVPNLNDEPFVGGFGNAGNIQRIAYENAVFETTSAADGSFSIKLPALVDAAGNAIGGFSGYTVSFEEFSTPKTLLMPGMSSNQNYSNNPYNLYFNRATTTTDLPENTNGFIKLKTYQESRTYRNPSFTIATGRMGEKSMMMEFYDDYKN